MRPGSFEGVGRLFDHAEALRWYHRHGERWQLDRLVGRIEHPPELPSATEDVEATVTGELPQERFLVATTGAGLLLVAPGEVVRLMAGSYYGITRHDEWWYVFERMRFGGRIVRFRLLAREVTNVEVCIWGLSPGVHQIDAVGSELWVVDTYHNRLLRYDLASLDTSRSWRTHGAAHLPSGRLAHGRTSSNYRHFNSIHAAGEEVWIVAHNETNKTKRPSELVCLDRSGSVIEQRSLGSSNAHNVVFLDETQVLSCASMEGELRLGDRVVLSTGELTRGVAVTADHVVVGGSGRADRTNRAAVDSSLYVLNRSFERMATITIPRSQVHEVRAVDGPDLGLSNHALAHVAPSP